MTKHDRPELRGRPLLAHPATLLVRHGLEAIHDAARHAADIVEFGSDNPSLTVWLDHTGALRPVALVVLGAAVACPAVREWLHRQDL